MYSIRGYVDTVVSRASTHSRHVPHLRGHCSSFYTNVYPGKRPQRPKSQVMFKCPVQDTTVLCYYTYVSILLTLIGPKLSLGHFYRNSSCIIIYHHHSQRISTKTHYNTQCHALVWSKCRNALSDSCIYVLLWLSQNK